MKHIIPVMVVAASFALTACDSNKSDAEEALRITLKDPESARFGEFYFNTRTNKGCLAVNAKNSMGGYTGNQQAYMEKTAKGWENFGIADIPLSSCREIYADRAR